MFYVFFLCMEIPSKKISPRVWSFCKRLGVIVQIGRCRIFELAGILMRYSPQCRGAASRGAASIVDFNCQPNCSQDPCAQVWSFSKLLRVILLMGGCPISDLAGILGRYNKISPRSSHPSPPRCCIPNEFQNFAIHAATWRRPGSAP